MPTNPNEELAKLRELCGYGPSNGNSGDDAILVASWIRHMAELRDRLLAVADEMGKIAG